LIALVPGGIVSLGSDVATLQQTIAATSAVEVLRSDLIGKNVTSGARLLLQADVCL
jgi:hypothetical protein